MQMKRKRFLSLVLTVVMVICLMPSPTANAATMTGGEVLYLKPNSNWNVDNARFAAYFYGSGDAWASMTDSNGDGIYEVTVPSGSWTHVIFCRMNPSTTANNWSNKWNQTGDLVYNGTNNLYIMTESSWDSGTWSTYTQTYTVAGVADLCGTGWDTTNTDNDMVLNPETNLYEKTFTNIAVGTYSFKVVVSHSWNYAAWPASDYVFTVTDEYTVSNVIVSFNESTKAITVATTCAHGGTTTENDSATCSSGGTKTIICDECGTPLHTESSAATGKHTYSAGVCSGCGYICQHATHNTNGICTVCASSVEHNYVNGFCSVCNFERAVQAQIGETEFATLADALAAAEAGSTVQLLKQAEIASLILMEEISLDLNGCTLTVGHVAAYPGSTVIDSAGGGLLKVGKNHVMLQKDNGYLPIWSSEDSGYVLVPCKKLNSKEDNKTEDSLTYKFLPSMGLDAYRLMSAGAETSGVTMKVVVSWDKGSGLTGSTTFTYSDGLLQAVYNSYDSEKGTFTEIFTLGLSGISGKEGLTFTVYFESDTGVLLECKTATAE